MLRELNMGAIFSRLMNYHHKKKEYFAIITFHEFSENNRKSTELCVHDEVIIILL